MRLIHSGPGDSVRLTKDLPTADAPYAILSHTWGSDEDELTLRDIVDGSFQTNAGAAKLRFCLRRASLDGLKYSWIDTCCIDRTNLVELSEAITSMYRWYHSAAKCYVYLVDVSCGNVEASAMQNTWKADFCRSRWFRRGWTLQELLAPSTVEFFSREGMFLGSRRSLEDLIHQITRIPIAALQGQPLSHFTTSERFRWTEGRETRRIEDRAYCLVGIFGVSLVPLYGEGDRAIVRLQREVEGHNTGKLQQDLIQWLSPSQPQKPHTRALRSRHPGTALMAQYPDLLTWLEGGVSVNRLIWVTGKSGAGKTTLFSNIVEEMRKVTTVTPDLSFAFHYCSSNDTLSLRTVNILGSLIAMISERVPRILQDLGKIFEGDRQRGQNKTLQTWELEEILAQYASEIGPIRLLIDALNESEDPNESMACVTRLLQTLPSLKVLVTSTILPTSMSNEECLSWCEVRMNPDVDIRSFVEAKLSNTNMRCRLSTETRNTIKSTLSLKADGSFRWVDLALQSICKEYTGKNALSALSRVPEGLNELYASLLDQIPFRDKEIAKEALKWVIFAARPMTVLELSEATVLTVSDSTMSQDSRLHPPEVILEICHGFLELDGPTREVKVAHASVRDYLLSAEVNTHFVFDRDQINRELMRKCLTYLMFDDFRCGAAHCPHELAARQQQFPLLNYVAHYWAIHAVSATGADWKFANDMLATRSQPLGGNYGAWASCLVPYYEPSDVVETETLYYAASFGFTPLLKAILAGSSSVDIDHPGGRHGSTPLQVACFRGQREAAENLLAAGADFWSIDDGSGRPPWFWAEANGWHEMVAKMIQLKPEIAEDIKLTPKDRNWAKRYQAYFSRNREWVEHYQAYYMLEVPRHHGQ